MKKLLVNALILGLSVVPPSASDAAPICPPVIVPSDNLISEIFDVFDSDISDPDAYLAALAAALKECETGSVETESLLTPQILALALGVASVALVALITNLLAIRRRLSSKEK